ncbi:MAG: hypothetical protein IKI29_06435 [Clostridia bacterium]|nr:hypothetical protein [Clostridia bacterium]
MSAFFLAFLFGVLQTFLLSRLVFAVTANNIKYIWLFLLLKFFCYGFAIAMLMVKYIEWIVYCACGFAAGMPLSAVIYFIYRSYKQSARKKGR